MKHDDRCPQCKRFVPKDADGYYDRLDRADDMSEIRVFCDKRCADKFHSSSQGARP